jgi:hypothetical protein
MKPMTKTKLIALALAPVAMLALGGCATVHSSPFAESNPNSAYQEGVPGGANVETHEVTAKVTALDKEKRMVTLVGDNGETTTVYCGPAVKNFDQIHVDDKVTVLLADALVVALGDTKNPTADGSSTSVLLAPKGAKPGAIMAETQQITVKLAGIDTLRHWATFRFPDGTLRNYAVRPDVVIDHIPLGTELVIRTTQVTAVWVKCP